MLFHLLKTLRLKIRFLQEKWQAKTPKQKFDFFHDMGQLTSEMIGVYIFGDLKNNWYSAFGGICGMIYFALNIYTIQYYCRQSKYARGLQCTYLIGMIIVVSYSIGFNLNFFSR